MTSDQVVRVATTAEESALDEVARRLCWWQSPAEARRDDIHALLASGVRLEDGLAWAKTVYGSDLNTMLPLQALCYFQEPSLRDLPQKVKDNLVRAVQGLGWIGRRLAAPQARRARDRVAQVCNLTYRRFAVGRRRHRHDVSTGKRGRDGRWLTACVGGGGVAMLRAEPRKCS